MKKFILYTTFLSAITFIACENRNEIFTSSLKGVLKKMNSSKDYKKLKIIAKVPVKNQNIDSFSSIDIKRKNESILYVFNYKSDTLAQNLKVWFLSAKKIYFELELISKSNNLNIENFAYQRQASFDGETLTNENHELFFVKEYTTSFNARPLVLSIDEEYRLAGISIHDKLGMQNDIFNNNILMYNVKNKIIN